MEELKVFLLQRDVPEEFINRMMDEKIDCKVILLMNDEQLKKYLPSYGDRVAIKEFCRREEAPLPKLHSRSSTLMARLRKRIQSFSKGSENDTTDMPSKHKGNKSAEKKTRKIELSYFHQDIKTKTIKQVRKNSGGGTRSMEVIKTTTMQQLLEKAKQLYFTDGESCRGMLTDFNVKLSDVNFCDVKDDATVESYYDRQKMRLLRFNFIASFKDEESEDESGNTCSQSETNKLPVKDPHQYLSYENPKLNSFTTQSKADYKISEGTFCQSDQASIVFETESIVKNTGQILAEDDSSVNFSLHSSLSKSVPGFGNDIVSEALQASMLPVTIIDDVASYETFPPNVKISKETSINDMSVDEEVAFGPFLDYDSASLDSTIPLESEIQSQNKTIVLKIHRSNILNELMNSFKTPEILKTNVEVEMILPNGVSERGQGGGVFRDCLTPWWGEFYEQCTLGSETKVPFIRHDYQMEEWTAVARIIKKGFTEFEYLPVQLSVVILESAMYGNYFTNLVEDFLTFLSPVERDTVRSSLANFQEVDNEDLMEFLEAHDCRKIPNAENIQSIVHELAHKDLVQKPKYIVDCFSVVLKDLSYTLPHEKLQRLHIALQPNTKGVLSMLSFPSNLSSDDRNIMHYLRQYIKESDKEKLKLFLRFCTGADLLLPSINVISIEFNNTEGLARTPFASTCSCILKLSNTYENFPTFRAEFNSILSSDIWVMDVV